MIDQILPEGISYLQFESWMLLGDCLCFYEGIFLLAPMPWALIGRN